MAAKGLDAVFQHLRRAVLLREGSGITDDQLLESFVSNRDGAAFEALVRRHGRMVQGVCARVLRNVHDAEDAYQATFLVLAQKAAKVFPRAQVGNWLYGVANTTALRSRSAAAHRQARERQVDHMPERSSPEPADWNDLIPLLDQELTKLPSKYRVAIVLCDLEGRSRKDVAKQLKIPEGTLSSRLTTARQMLAKRLSRHGLAITGPVLASLMAQNALSACVPPTLVAATVKAASLIAAGQAVTSTLVSAPVLALKKGVLKVMLIHKLKSLTAVVVMLGALGYGGTMVSQCAGAQSKGAGTLRVPSAAIGSAETDDKPAKDGDGTRRVPATDNDTPLKPLEKERAEHQRQMNNLLLNVEVAYWDLYEAYGRLYSWDKCLSDLEKLRTMKDGNVDKVVLAKIPVQRAEIQGERTIAAMKVMQSEDKLREIIGMRRAKDEYVRLVPVSLPSVKPFDTAQDEILKTARKNGPVMQLAKDKWLTDELLGALVGKDEDVIRAVLEREQLISAKQLEEWRKERRDYTDSLAKMLQLAEEGQNPIDLDFLTYQRQLCLIEMKGYRAIAGYNRTLARLDFATGNMRMGLVVADGESLLHSSIEIVKAENPRVPTKILRLRKRADMLAPLDETLSGPKLSAFLEKGGIPGVTEIAKTYIIQMKLSEADPDGEDGNGQVLSTPTMFLEDGQTGLVSIGQTIPAPKAGDAMAKKELTAGSIVQITVVGQRNGLLHLETSLQISHVDQADDKNSQVSGLMLRAVNLVKEGETNILSIKNHKNEVTHRLQIKVSEVNEELKQKAPPQTRIVPGSESISYPATWSQPGILRRSTFGNELAAYALEDSKGHVLLYVNGQKGFSLEGYIDRTVSVYGSINYRSDDVLRTFVMQATHVAVY